MMDQDDQGDTDQDVEEDREGRTRGGAGRDSYGVHH